MVYIYEYLYTMIIYAEYMVTTLNINYYNLFFFSFEDLLFRETNTAGDYSFSTYPKLPEKQAFLNP